MGKTKNFAFETIEGCIEKGGGRTSAARLSVRFTTLGVATTPDQAAELAQLLGFKVTKRRVTINGTDTTQHVVQ